MEREWPFFSALLSNAEMACAKADLTVGRRYAELVDDREVRERIWSRIEAEFGRTCDALLAVTSQERLLAREPLLRASIDRRNPYVDPMSLLQVELLRRVPRGGRRRRRGAGARELPRHQRHRGGDAQHGLSGEGRSILASPSRRWRNW